MCEPALFMQWLCWLLKLRRQMCARFLQIFTFGRSNSSNGKGDAGSIKITVKLAKSAYSSVLRLVRCLHNYFHFSYLHQLTMHQLPIFFASIANCFLHRCFFWLYEYRMILQALASNFQFGFLPIL